MTEDNAAASVGGWIKAYRKMLENPQLQEHDVRGVFLLFLMQAQRHPRDVWVDKLGRAIPLERGQCWTTIRSLVTAGCKKNRIERILKVLKSGTVIETESRTGVTIVTICKYDDYQGMISGGRTPNGGDGRTVAGQWPDTEQDSIPNPSCDSVTPRESVFNDRQIETYSRNSESPPPHARADARVRAGSSGDDLFDGGERQIKPRPDLAFNGSVIRMSPQRFDEFVELYPEITNHRAELHSLDLWIATLDKDKRQNWESVLASAMAKKINNPAFRNGTGRAQEEDETPAWLVPGYGGIKD